MITLTLRRRGGSVVVSLPRKILSLLDLDAGAMVRMTVENGKVVMAPVGRRPTLAEGLRARAALERKLGERLRDAKAGASSIGGRVPSQLDDSSPNNSIPDRRRLRAPVARRADD
jgi:antitoxin component of MazEF toxin-antitoxin module